MVGSLGLNGASAAEVLPEKFDPTAVVAEPLPPVVLTNGDPGDVEGDLKDFMEKGRQIVLGRNVHTTCLAVTEPEANDDFTGDKEAYMASVLARYRRTLVERTKHHLGTCCFVAFLHLPIRSLSRIF